MHCFSEVGLQAYNMLISVLICKSFQIPEIYAAHFLKNFVNEKQVFFNFTENIIYFSSSKETNCPPPQLSNHSGKALEIWLIIIT